MGEIAAEGGAWGIAVLAAFLTQRAPDQTLADYLAADVFAAAKLDVVDPDPDDLKGFDSFMRRYVDALAVQRSAVEHT